MDLVHYITKLQTNVFAIRNDDDLADRLNYRYTVAILVAFAIIVSHRQFSETVIKCWVPAFFTPNYEAYANQVCWISNTYYVNQTQNVPKSDDTRKSSEIKYYQWIPFILLIQALFLYIPRILWRLLSARAGLDMRDLIEAAHSYKSVEKYSNKKKIMEYIVQNIDQYASNPRRSKPRDSIFQKIKYFGESLFCGSGIYLGNYLVTTYFFIKIAYLLNSIIQFFVMNEFLGKQFHELGLDIIRYLTNTYSTETSIESVYFPKVVMCDFRIREFGHPNFSHRYTIQCVLPINLYNQQIFTFLWFWFLILFLANAWALCQWINRMLPTSRRRYINKRLNMLRYFKELNENTSVVLKPRGFFGKRKPVSPEAKRQKRMFIDDYLKFDGVFILRMISMLTSEIVGTELLHELWNKRAVYKELTEEEHYSNYNENNGSYMNQSNNHVYPIDNQPGQVIYDNEKYDFSSKTDLNYINSYLSNNNIPMPTDYTTKQRSSSMTDPTQINDGDFGSEPSFEQKRAKIPRIKQQFSMDLSAQTTNRIKLKRIKSQSNENQFNPNEENQNMNTVPEYNRGISAPVYSSSLKSSQQPQASILNQPSLNPNAKSRASVKKVVFAPMTNRENSLDVKISDVDDVFSDLKLDT